MNQMASHTSHGFNQASGKNTALASLSNMQSQSSSQLPSAHVTGNLIKGAPQNSKKQMMNQPNSSSQAQLSSNPNFGQMKQNQKMKYDDLKKFLLKEYGASQANYILQQHANGQISSSQVQFAGISNEMQRSANSGLGKQKKSMQSQGQFQSVQSFDKFDQVQVGLD